MTVELRVLPVEGIPEVSEGDRIGKLISEREALEPGDVIVISQKIVSKAEGRVRALSEVQPSERARELAEKLNKDPRLVDLILSESREILRAERGALITETHHGLVCANAGIDTSNLPDDGSACLLPNDPDASARKIRAEIAGGPGVGVGGQQRGASGDPHTRPHPVAIVIADSFGRPWRLGQTEVAIGCAGLQAIDDWRGRTDASGRELSATVIAIADQVAAAADLVRMKDSRTPVAIVRGLDHYVIAQNGPGAAALRRPRSEDLFR